MAGANKSSVVVGAVREWLRMEAHLGIIFVTTVTGERRAALESGPQVWTVAESWLQHDRDEHSPGVVADVLGLSVADVETALAYWPTTATRSTIWSAAITPARTRRWRRGSVGEPSMPSEPAVLRFVLDVHYPAWLADDLRLTASMQWH